MSAYPILYSFRRCPYAMRARLAIASSGLQVELREVVLKDKPAQLTQVSAKATVPVLITTTGEVIDESLDIMHWALSQHDPQHWLQSLTDDEKLICRRLIERNDGEFKFFLDRYKYADRYPEQTESDYRQQAEQTLALLETQLVTNGGLIRADWCLADIAILPFIRQFAAVDENWFANAPYPKLRQWLNAFVTSDLFNRVMKKQPQWQADQPLLLFP